MNDETLRTLITCAFSFGGILVANIITYLTTMNTNHKRDRKISINEERYNKLFSPIHKIIYFSQDDDINKMVSIRNIIFTNYYLSTDNVRDRFLQCEKKKRITNEFKEIIDDGCRCLEKELGYTNSKLNKAQKEISKTVVTKEEKTFSFMPFRIIITIIFIVITAIMVFLTTLYIISPESYKGIMIEISDWITNYDPIELFLIVIFPFNLLIIPRIMKKWSD